MPDYHMRSAAAHRPGILAAVAHRTAVVVHMRAIGVAVHMRVLAVVVHMQAIEVQDTANRRVGTEVARMLVDTVPVAGKVRKLKDMLKESAVVQVCYQELEAAARSSIVADTDKTCFKRRTRYCTANMWSLERGMSRSKVFVGTRCVIFALVVDPRKAWLSRAI